jgi:hypothetical protein
MSRPKVNSDSQKELDKAQASFDAFSETVSKFNPLDAKGTMHEEEPQTKVSNRELNKQDAPYIKPIRSIHSKDRPQEKYKEKHARDWEYVRCIVENKEIIGEAVECWTKKYPGDPAHFWKIPVNKAIYIPRLLANQLANCKYHRLRTEDQITSDEGFIKQYGTVVVDYVKNRIDARPVGNSFLAFGS